MSESPLRSAIEAAAAEHGLSMKDLTVLAPQRDPFRLDTPANHRDGAWFGEQVDQFVRAGASVHLRGLHYIVATAAVVKPDGRPYTNTDPDWLWLSENCGKAARWLGYVPFDRIIDQRNAAPEIRVAERPGRPFPYVSAKLNVSIPDVDDLEPRIGLGWFRGMQPYKLVIFGEKSSLGEVLGPVAQSYGADLYLPTGEISDTLLHQMAKVGAEDGRPMVVLTFSDCDPAGWQMPISIGRKLQAFRESLFPGLQFRVHRVGLVPDQVRKYALPSTPLKDTEKRADRWRESTGVEQTEIDALAALRPDLLRQIARDAITAFYDLTLTRRVNAACDEWEEQAQAAVDQLVDPEWLAEIQHHAERRLEELREEIQRLNDQVQIDVSDLDLPAIPPVPEAEVSGDYGLPLLDSRWSFVEQCRALKASKAYEAGGPDD